MKRAIIKILIFYGLTISCYKPYSPDIEANEKILVAEGLVTNEEASNVVRLSYTLPFDERGSIQLVNSAQVHITDDLDNDYPFREIRTGYYISDPEQFTGQSGRAYTLHIETPDGEKYKSAPQLLLPDFSPDTVYAEYKYKEILSRFNKVLTVSPGADIKIDIRSATDSLPRFRFTSNIVKQYSYSLFIPPPAFDPPLYLFYCWQTADTNPDINLTEMKYSLNTSVISRHSVYFLEDQIFFDAFFYGLGARQPDLSYSAFITTERQSYAVSQRILYLNQYTLNNETYSYYQSIDELLRSEGKLFDPIAVQLAGNISCSTNPDRRVFGFFEASSVSRTSYVIGHRDRNTNQYSITTVPYVLPPEPNGCWIDKTPPFWIF